MVQEFRPKGTLDTENTLMLMHCQKIYRVIEAHNTLLSITEKRNIISELK